MNESGNPCEKTAHESNALSAKIDCLQRRLYALLIAVVFLALAVTLNAAAVYGYLVNYFGGDALMFGATAAAAALLGFGFGWFARGRKSMQPR